MNPAGASQPPAAPALPMPPDAARRPLLEAKEITYQYADGTRALDALSLAVHRGEVLAVAGANGSGKTTLLRHLCGLLAPAAGVVLLEGRPLGDLGAAAVLSRVGMIFQDPNDQVVAATVGEDAAFGPLNLGVAPDEARRRAEAALARVGALDLFARPVFNLSFGQMKRAAIAGVLAMRPEALLLDEPASGLDPAGSRTLLDLLRTLARTEGLAVVMSTHDMDLIPEYADRLIVLAAGRIVAEGTPAEVFRDGAAVRHSGLDLPAVARMFEMLPALGVEPPASPPLTPAAAAAWVAQRLSARGAAG
ncbi:MAG: ATP-binding cassette domain-containing protein [Planctomycetes bacterium]|nr:ATP-binding cassette domain-containing protein [Planctomycetota bacterium]